MLQILFSQCRWQHLRVTQFNMALVAPSSCGDQPFFSGEQAYNRGGQKVRTQRGDQLNLSGAQLYFTEEQLLF